MAKKQQVGADGVTLTAVDMTFVDEVIEVIKSPFALFESETKVYLPARTVGLGVVGGLAGGIFLGDRFGASIPLLGGRRN